MTQKVFALAVLIATGLWFAIDRLHSRDVEQIFLDTLSNELEAHAARDRHEFDRQVQAHHRAARLIVAQRRFTDYLAVADWQLPPDKGPRWHRSAPPWLPAPSVLRAFFNARFTLLLDAEGRAREIYRLLPTPVPGVLLSPSALLQKLSHHQSYLTAIDGQPFALAAEPFVIGNTRGTLLLASPIDDEFLRESGSAASSQSFVALLGGMPRRVLSSSNPFEVKPGLTLEQLHEHFVVSGKSFFDYGAADLDAQFASLLPRAKVQVQMSSVLAKEHAKRTWMVAALTVPFLLLTYWIARRIRTLALQVDDLSRTVLGGRALPPVRGDELSDLMLRFRIFSSELVNARDALRAETEHKVKLAQAAVEAEQRARQASQLRAVTEALGAGVIVLDAEGPVPANTVMKQIIGECGMDPFVIAPEQDGVVLHLSDNRGRERVFRIDRAAMSREQALFVRDITQQSELERERNLFASLPAESPNPVLRVDASGTVTYANQASEPLLHDWQIRAGERLPDSLQARLCEGGETLEVAAGGRIYSLLFVRIRDSEFAYLYGADITGRKAAEAAVAASEARFRGLLEAAPDAILMVDAAGNIAYAGGKAHALFGQAPDDLIGRPVADLIPEESRHSHADNIARYRQRPELVPIGGVRPTVVALRSDGSRFPAEIGLSPLAEHGAVIAIVRDVSEREQAAREISELNEQLRHHVADLTRMNRELESFSYTVSHDLRGPLRAIDGFSQMVLQEYGPQLPLEARDDIERIRASSARMSELIDGLLRLSRISRTEVQVQTVDLSAAARTIADTLRRTEPARDVVFDVADGLHAEGDASLLYVALENLINNAWKFTARREPACISIGREETEDGPAFVVRDNGAGFDMADASRLFNPFERLHEVREFPGSGIGLATVARIIERHDGRIWADAAPDKGASFYFTLSSGAH